MSPIPYFVGSNSSHGALVPIARATSNGTQGDFAFNNIPQTYQDLRFVVSANKIAGSYDSFFTVNGDFTGNTGSRNILLGDGANFTSTRRTNDSVVYLPITTSNINSYTNLTIDILNYRSSSYKTIIVRGASDQYGSGYTYILSSLKQITAPITSIDLNGNDGNYSIGSTFTLYGIRSIGQ